MVRTTRKMPALVSTIALIAGCGSSTRAEVSGVVVDALTGRAIAGARVVAPDGSATRTDADGRFTLSVRRGEGREIRASAAGREDARTRIDVRVDQNASIVIQLVPEAESDAVLVIDDERAPRDPDAVLRWIDDLELEEWLVRGARQPEDGPAAPEVGAGDSRDDATSCSACPTQPSAWGAREQWALGSMRLGATRLGSTPVADTGCASCHDAAVFAGAHGSASAPATPDGECTACHDASAEPARRGLRMYETASAVAAEPAIALGSGALCVECHRAVDDAPMHAPQADVVLGRGARSLARDALGAPAHGAIADTCVACHAAPWRAADPEELTLGHTFAVRGASGALAEGACSACHGRVAPESIARGDWDGDGVCGPLGDEHDRALARVRARIEARIRAARIAVSCGEGPQSAAGLREHQGAIVLVDVRRVMLGDCDEDGQFEAGEQPVTVEALPRALRDAAWDVMLLERDGSRGVHNPDFAFALLGAIESRL